MQILKIGLPKGRLLEPILDILKKSGINIKISDMNYKSESNLKNINFYLLKPRNIPKMVESRKLDAGFISKDLVDDEKADVRLDLNLNISAFRTVLATKGLLKENPIIATEYINIASEYLKKNKLNATLVRSYGCTECFVPDFADAIIDNVETGATLKANGLNILDIISESTTYFVSNKTVEQFVFDDFKNRLINNIKP